MIKIKTLWTEQNGKCYFCCNPMTLKKSDQKKLKASDATREHLIPKAKGGSNRAVNLKCSCYKCNKDRGDMCALEWMRIVRVPGKLQEFYDEKSRMKALAKKRKRKRTLSRRKERYQVFFDTGIMLKFLYITQDEFNDLFDS